MAVNFAVDQEWKTRWAKFHEKLEEAIKGSEADRVSSASGARASDDAAKACGVYKGDLSDFLNYTGRGTSSKTTAENIADALEGAKPSEVKGFESTGTVDRFWSNAENQRLWLVNNPKHGLRAQIRQVLENPTFDPLPISAQPIVPKPDAASAKGSPQETSNLFSLPPHHDPSELADFLPRPIPLSNKDEEGRAPLLMKFLFNDVEVRLGGEETAFHLRVNSATLRVRLTTPATNVANDRVEEALNGSKLRLKAQRTLDDRGCGWLIENPADGEQLEGAFDWIHLCYVSQADRASGMADLSVTSGQIAVCQDGRRLADGAHSKAAKVVQQWAVWAGLGEPANGEAVYHFPRRGIGNGSADDE